MYFCYVEYTPFDWWSGSHFSWREWLDGWFCSGCQTFRISDLVIGLTIVAFGTSAPELVISVLSALNGSAEMAIGNVVGSNIFNALMIIGCTALVLPIKVGEGTMSKEIPLVILSSLVLLSVPMT